MTFTVREWRNDAISSGARRFRKWCTAFPQVVHGVSASGARRFRKWCTALEQWLSAIGFDFVSDFIFF